MRWLLVLPLLLLTGTDDPLQVTIYNPLPGESAFGEVTFSADVWPSESVDRVEFFVDGRRVGELLRPPFRIQVDVGHDNAEHHFQVVAHSVSGDRVTANLKTPPMRIDMELDVELQQLYVTVTRNDLRVLDLERDAFTIRDSGAVQRIVTFARGDVPLTAVLALDSSASMRGEPLQAALEGAQAFIGGMRPLDEAKLLLFSDRLLHGSPFTSFPTVLTAGLGQVEAKGGTALNDHLFLALKLLEARQGRRVVVLLSDGIDVHSSLRMEEVLWMARRSQALIYWIRLVEREGGDIGQHYSSWRNPQQHLKEFRTLQSTVREGGGRIYEVRKIDQVESAFQEVMQELRDQYVLGYYPSNLRNDGSWHKVRVEIARPGLQIRTRDGYIDF